MNVLVTGGGALLGQGIIKALRMSTLPHRLIVADPSPLAAGLYRGDRARLIPMASDPRYVDVLTQLIREEGADVVLIGTDVELPVLAAHRPQIERETGATVVVSSPEVIAIADDKWLTYEFLRRHGFPYPASCLPNDLDAFLAAASFPLVVKPRVGARSVDVSVVHDEADLRRAVQTLPHPIIQEWLVPETEEFTVGALVFDGTVFGVIAMQRVLRDGNTYRAFVRAYPDITRAVAEMARALGPTGPANFQLRRTARGATVFEINARFSGTTPFRAALGFNEVDATVRRLVLGESIAPLTFREGLILRYLNEVVVSLDEYAQLESTGALDRPRSETLTSF